MCTQELLINFPVCVLWGEMFPVKVCECVRLVEHVYCGKLVCEGCVMCESGTRMCGVCPCVCTNSAVFTDNGIIHQLHS